MPSPAAGLNPSVPRGTRPRNACRGCVDGNLIGTRSRDSMPLKGEVARRWRAAVCEHFNTRRGAVANPPGDRTGPGSATIRPEVDYEVELQLRRKSQKGTVPGKRIRSNWLTTTRRREPPRGRPIGRARIRFRAGQAGSAYRQFEHPVVVRVGCPGHVRPEGSLDFRDSVTICQPGRSGRFTACTASSTSTTFRAGSCPFER